LSLSGCPIDLFTVFCGCRCRPTVIGCRLSLLNCSSLWVRLSMSVDYHCRFWFVAAVVAASSALVACRLSLLACFCLLLAIVACYRCSLFYPWLSLPAIVARFLLMLHSCSRITVGCRCCFLLMVHSCSRITVGCRCQLLLFFMVGNFASSGIPAPAIHSCDFSGCHHLNSH
jgi:hypothetical protein